MKVGSHCGFGIYQTKNGFSWEHGKGFMSLNSVCADIESYIYLQNDSCKN